ncbi:hypothetical protein EPUS_07352 [Endocarpon pusillum Z07020]|uniref:Deacetylase sirtuin-type domain-containing protein n=1 Tax=Endocarpon pusillum (strain Z07020 / HMAS-L-300199) TaxID=1263415 RepID=U1GFH5_ENDPU|nr:uncharacterized protein EPUS_07352 [Endocarpon pusillum Z07020]ERF70496.1 hypothetical protein EPUS_07352 [Endocarpon pusillum Z07020]
MPLQEIGAQDDRLLQDIADRMVKSHKILLITGAGISTSCGIPDFRSKDGLYNLIPEQTPTPMSSMPSTPSRSRYSSEEYFPSSRPTTSSRVTVSPTSKLKGQDLFDASVWKNAHTTEVFYRFIASLRQKIRDEVKETSPTHKFIRTLRDGGRLMRCYTQNIDGLERRENLSMDLGHGKGTKKRFMKKVWEAPRPEAAQNSDADGGCEVVPLHGDLEVLRCTLCLERSPWTEEMTERFLNGLAPECSVCARKSCDRQERGKRGVAVGSLRPNIVLYGEEHPSNQLLAPLVPFDLGSGPEILIIMGTSLKVHGLQKVVREFAKKIHARKDGKGKVIFVNRTKPAESVWENVIDSYVAMDCDDWVMDLKRRRQDLWWRQGELDLKTTKPTTKKRKCTTDDSPTPSKRPKIVVEVPTRRRTMTATPWKPEVMKAEPDSSLMTPPPSRGKGSASTQRSDTPPPFEPLTPPYSGPTFKRLLFNNPFRRLFSTPAQPPSSPPRNTWKPSILQSDRSGMTSPERPSVFSPIEERAERRTKRSQQVIYEDDPELEIAESQDEDGEEREGSGSVLDTPSKRKIEVLRPISDSALNLGMGREWPVEAGKRTVALAGEELEGGRTAKRRKRASVA